MAASVARPSTNRALPFLSRMTQENVDDPADRDRNARDHRRREDGWPTDGSLLRRHTGVRQPAARLVARDLLGLDRLRGGLLGLVSRRALALDARQPVSRG